MTNVLRAYLAETDLAEVKTDHPCPEKGCGIRFKKLPNLNLHIVRHHMKGNFAKKLDNRIVEYYCPVLECAYNEKSSEKKFFAQRRFLKQHYLKVHALKRFSCGRCGLRSAIPAAIKRHAARCEQKYECADCPWKGNSNESLLVHVSRKHPLRRRMMKDLTSGNIIEFDHHKMAKDDKKSQSAKVEKCHSKRKRSSVDPISSSISIIRGNVALDFIFLEHNYSKNSLQISTKARKLNDEAMHPQENPIRETISVKKEAELNNEKLKFSNELLITERVQSAETIESNAVRVDRFTQTTLKTVRKSKTVYRNRFHAETQTPDETSDSEIPEYENSSANRLTGSISPDLDGKRFFDIETQTALDELLYCGGSSGGLFPDLIGFSDIQTQTRDPPSEARACCCSFGDGPPCGRSRPMSSSRTRTGSSSADLFLKRKSDVLLSCVSTGNDPQTPLKS